MKQRSLLLSLTPNRQVRVELAPDAVDLFHAATVEGVQDPTNELHDGNDGSDGSDGGDESSPLLCTDTARVEEESDGGTAVVEVGSHMVVGTSLTALDSRRPLMVRNAVGEEEFAAEVARINRAATLRTLPGLICSFIAITGILNVVVVMAAMGTLFYVADVSAGVAGGVLTLLLVFLFAIGVMSVWSDQRKEKFVSAAVKDASRRWEPRGIQWILQRTRYTITTGSTTSQVIIYRV